MLVREQEQQIGPLSSRRVAQGKPLVRRDFLQVGERRRIRLHRRRDEAVVDRRRRIECLRDALLRDEQRDAVLA